MIDRSVICGKLAQLRDRQGLLQQLGTETRAQFVSNPMAVGAAERGLQVSIEICLDLGHHLIAARNLARPSEYRDVFRILGTAGIIAPEFATRLEKMAAFRNRLVHVYAEIDPDQVYDFLQKDRADFDEFARIVASIVAAEQAS